MLELNYNDNRELYQYAGTRLQIYSLGTDINHNLKYNFTNTTKEDEYYISNFFTAQQGKLKRFWIPYYKNSFVPVAATVFGDIVEIEQAGFNEVDRGAERIFIKLKDGTIYTRKVVAIINNGVTELIILQTPFVQPIQVADVKFFGRIFLVRFNEDECEIDFRSDTVSTCSLSFQEIYPESLEVVS